MPNDIENDIWPNQINLSEIGKYNKFVDFGIKDNDHPHFSRLFYFTTNEQKKEKLTKHDRDSAIGRMFFTLQDGIEKEVEKQLRNEINEIRKKAEKRIEKLKEKPRKKLRKLKGYNELFKLYSRQDSEEGY